MATFMLLRRSTWLEGKRGKTGTIKSARLFTTVRIVLEKRKGSTIGNLLDVVVSAPFLPPQFTL